MIQNLENKIKGKIRPEFKSEGERRIAYFLDGNSIRYQYEAGVLVNSVDDKPRIWYPDFHLPEFGTYIEYFGLAGQQDYDRGIKKKEKVYSEMGLSIIPVYPWMFTENWQGYIMKKLEQTTSQRYKNLMTKPYWSQNKTFKYSQSTSSQRRYCHEFGKRY